MEKQKRNDVAALLRYAGGHKGLTFLGLALSGLAMLLSMVPYICIWLAARDLIAAAPDWTQAESVAQYGWLAFAFCGGRHCDLLSGVDVHPSGGLPHGVQHPQARRRSCDESSVRLF